MSTAAVLPLPPDRSLPENLRAGDSLAWTVRTQLALASNVFYVLNGIIANTPTRILIGRDTNGNYLNPVDGNGYATFAIPSSATSAWLAGRYDWVLFGLDSTGDRTQLAEGSVTIDPDPAGATPIDTRTQNQKDLAAIRIVLSGKAGEDAQMYKPGGRELTRYTFKELREQEAILVARVRNEVRQRNGKPNRMGTVAVAFGGR